MYISASKSVVSVLPAWLCTADHPLECSLPKIQVFNLSRFWSRRTRTQLVHSCKSEHLNLFRTTDNPDHNNSQRFESTLLVLPIRGGYSLQASMVYFTEKIWRMPIENNALSRINAERKISSHVLMKSGCVCLRLCVSSPLICIDGKRNTLVDICQIAHSSDIAMIIAL